MSGRQSVWRQTLIRIILSSKASSNRYIWNIWTQTDFLYQPALWDSGNKKPGNVWFVQDQDWAEMTRRSQREGGRVWGGGGGSQVRCSLLASDSLEPACAQWGSPTTILMTLCVLVSGAFWPFILCHVSAPHEDQHGFPVSLGSLGDYLS